VSWRGKPDFDYGNTRLRARRSSLLVASDYEDLLGEDVDSLLTTLRDTGYAPDREAPRLGGLDGLHSTIRLNLGRSLEEMRTFYLGRARGLVDALLSRFDLQNVITLLRSRSRAGITAEETVAALTPVGWLKEPIARDILKAQELAGLVDLLADRTPDRSQAGVLRLAFGEYERTGDVAGLERAVLGEHATRLAERLGQPGPGGTALLRLVQRETDQHNMLVILRLREAVVAGADDTPPPQETLLAGGTLSPDALAAVMKVATRATTVSMLVGVGRREWAPALEQWSATGDLNLLQASLERRTYATAIALFATGDPLAVDVPVAYTVAKQVEARNLRLLAEGAARAIAPVKLRSELLLSESA
jgi:V/A-type H+/Na+-transporting ATPase subunit C